MTLDTHSSADTVRTQGQKENGGNTKQTRNFDNLMENQMVPKKSDALYEHSKVAP